MEKRKSQIGAEQETEKKKYPIGPEHYTLFEEVGQGVSACVLRALCKPFDEIVAIKILDFERENCDLNNVFREAQTMVLVDHPNVLKSHCSFVSGHTLWVVMPFMAGGSCLHILKAAHPDGFGEAVIATILREILKGLEYLHHHGHIHRDVKSKLVTEDVVKGAVGSMISSIISVSNPLDPPIKPQQRRLKSWSPPRLSCHPSLAGNILIDARGAIKLGDFGVSACLFDSGDRQRVRNTFVGTPCWMAPEVMEQLHGYDFKADIWSFGITALELAHGHAPFSRYPPMKVLLMTLQHAPPGLDYERDRKFSRSFKQMIASCLVKDPSQRPSAKKLLKHSFFKQARSNDYIARTLLEGLPDLGDRIKELKRKEEDMLAQKKIPDGQKEEISQNEYKRGISGWYFDLDFLKDQASLIQDIDDTVSDTSQTGSSNSLSALDVNEKQLKCQSIPEISDMDTNCANQSQSAAIPSVQSTSYDYKSRRDKSDDEFSIASSSHEQHISQHSSPHADDRVENNLDKKHNSGNGGKILGALDVHSQDRSPGSLDNAVLPGLMSLQIKEESDKLQGQPQNCSNCNTAAVPHPGDDVFFDVSSRLSKSPDGEELDEKAKEPVVQQKGRFKVTSENVDVEKVVPTPTLQKSNSMQVIGTHQQVPLPSTLPSPSPSPLPSPSPSSPPSPPNATSSINFGSLFSLLNTVLETNIVQRDVILSIMKQVAASDFKANGGCTSSGIMERTLLEEALEREKKLLHEITDLSGRLLGIQDEKQKTKTENVEG